MDTQNVSQKNGVGFWCTTYSLTIYIYTYTQTYILRMKLFYSLCEQVGKDKLKHQSGGGRKHVNLGKDVPRNPKGQWLVNKPTVASKQT